MGNRPAENVLPNLSTTAVVPGSWAYELRGQPNEEADCDSSCRCQCELELELKLSNTNLNNPDVNAAGSSVHACYARKS